MQTIFFETSDGQQYKIEVIESEAGTVRGQLEEGDGKIISEKQFQKADLVTLPILHETTRQKVGEISFSKYILVDNTPADHMDIKYH